MESKCKAFQIDQSTSQKCQCTLSLFKQESCQLNDNSISLRMLFVLLYFDLIECMRLKMLSESVNY